jgi:hypothetical protein
VAPVFLNKNDYFHLYGWKDTGESGWCETINWLTSSLSTEPQLRPFSSPHDKPMISRCKINSPAPCVSAVMLMIEKITWPIYSHLIMVWVSDVSNENMQSLM